MQLPMLTQWLLVDCSCTWSPWASPHCAFSFPRARSSVAAQGLPGGHVRPDRHQLSDLRGLEDSAHGGHDMNMWFWEFHFQRN